MLVVVSLV